MSYSRSLHKTNIPIRYICCVIAKEKNAGPRRGPYLFGDELCSPPQTFIMFNLAFCEATVEVSTVHDPAGITRGFYLNDVHHRPSFVYIKKERPAPERAGGVVNLVLPQILRLEHED